MNVTILPADTYVVINKTVLHSEDRKLLTMLYQPIVGHTAISLYFTLVDDLDVYNKVSNELNHHHLMSIMQLSLEELLIARQKLEAVGLLKTYYKKGNVNNYVYLLYSPISANEFFNHPILNVVLYNNIGKKEYLKRQELFKVPRVRLTEFKDISLKFNEVYQSSNLKPFEVIDNIEKKNVAKLEVEDIIDFNQLIASIPSGLISNKCFNSEIKTLINNLSLVYSIDTERMSGLVRTSLNEKGLIDKQELRKNCRNYYSFENVGNLPTLIYQKQPDYLKKPEGDLSKWAKMAYTFENTSPYDFLRSKYKGAEPTKRDLQLIENLMCDQKLSAGVVNVLISYALKINNQKLNRSYLETIAGQWKRLNIETVEEAMKLTEKEYKKMKKIANNSSRSKTVKKKEVKEDILPDWFGKNIEMDNTNETLNKELNEIVDSLV